MGSNPVALPYGNRDNLWPDEPLGSYADLTFVVNVSCFRGKATVRKLTNTRLNYQSLQDMSVLTQLPATNTTVSGLKYMGPSTVGFSIALTL